MQPPLSKVTKADRAYRKSAARSEELRRARDAAIFEAHVAGQSYAQLAAELGVTRGRIQQVVERVRAEQDYREHFRAAASNSIPGPGE